MAVSSFLLAFLRFMSEPFYYYQWTGWKVLTIAMPVLLVLSLIIIWQRKQRARQTHVGRKQTRKHPHVIGAKLVKLKQRQEEITDIARDQAANIREKLAKHHNWKETTGRFEKLNREIEQLQQEIAKHGQTGSQLDQKVAELAPSNERLEDELAKSKQIEAQLDQKVVDLAACNEQLEQELAQNKQIETQRSQEITELAVRNERLEQGISETRDARSCLEEQLAESQVMNEQLRSKVAENNKVEEALKLTAQLGVSNAPRQLGAMLGKNPQQVGMSGQPEKPLDIDTLQAIAALIKQIQGRPSEN